MHIARSRYNALCCRAAGVFDRLGAHGKARNKTIIVIIAIIVIISITVIIVIIVIIITILIVTPRKVLILIESPPVRSSTR